VCTLKVKKGGSVVVDQESSEAPRGKKFILVVNGLETWHQIYHFGDRTLRGNWRENSRRLKVPKVEVNRSR